MTEINYIINYEEKQRSRTNVVGITANSPQAESYKNLQLVEQKYERSHEFIDITPPEGRGITLISNINSPEKYCLYIYLPNPEKKIFGIFYNPDTPPEGRGYVKSYSYFVRH